MARTKSKFGQFPYVSLGTAKEYLEINSDTHDNLISNVLFYATGIVENYIGMEILSNTYVEYHDGGSSCVFVNRIPINNVTEVAEYDGTQYVPLTFNGATAVSSEELPNVSANSSNVVQFVYHEETGKIQKPGDYTLRNRMISLNPVERFRDYPHGVRITYNGGYDSDVVPPDLKLALLEFVKLIYKKEQNKSSMSFQGENSDIASLSHNFPPHVKRVLDLYRILD